MFDKVLLVLLEGAPVFGVLAEIDLIDGPEAGHLVLIHLPDIVVLDGQDDEAVGILFKKGLRNDFLGLSSIDLADL